MASKPHHADVQDLIQSLILPFYHVKRDSPLPIGERRFENDAEHSWSLALLACALAPEVNKKLDVGKICQFAIAHDLVEIFADDTSNFADPEKVASKDVREEQALRKIEIEYAHFPWIVDTIHAYERKDTEEAKFVYALDKYLPVYFDYLDHAKLFRERKLTLDAYNKILEPHREKAHAHPAVAEYYDEIRDLINQHPEYFHQ
jgi:putative hydrolase of HD superfamily